MNKFLSLSAAMIGAANTISLFDDVVGVTAPGVVTSDAADLDTGVSIGVFGGGDIPPPMPTDFDYGYYDDEYEAEPEPVAEEPEEFTSVGSHPQGLFQDYYDEAQILAMGEAMYEAWEEADAADKQAADDVYAAILAAQVIINGAGEDRDGAWDVFSVNADVYTGDMGTDLKMNRWVA